MSTSYSLRLCFVRLLLLLLIIPPGRTQDARFYNPPPAAATLADATDCTQNLEWALDTVQTINYTTTYTNYTIVLYQQNPDDGEGSNTNGTLVFGKYLSTFVNFVSQTMKRRSS